METILMNTEHSKKPTQKRTATATTTTKKIKIKKERKSFPFITNRKIYDSST